MQSIRGQAKLLFEGVPHSVFQTLRPAICPFEELIHAVPKGSEVLDVGCGSGLFLGLLALNGRLGKAVGFDSNAEAIGRAQQMQSRLRTPELLSFACKDVAEDWPAGPFDVVSVIDVMHHVPPAAQRSVIERAAARLKPGGILLYKDMVARPAWRAWMNRAHDLVLARQWINYAPLQSVHDWAETAGLTEVRRAEFNMLWYGHELLVLKR